MTTRPLLAAVRCWLIHGGHEFHRPQWSEGRVRLLCVNCGHETAGIEAAPAPEPLRPNITRTRRRKPQRRQVISIERKVG